MKTKSKKIIKLETFSDLTRPIQKTKLKKTTKKDKELIFYIKPKETKNSLYIKGKDKNGKRIWIDGDAWLSPIDIKKPEDIKLLPKEIQEFFPKWEKEIERVIKEHKVELYKKSYSKFIFNKKVYYIYSNPIYYAYFKFIYEKKIYSIYPKAFKNNQRRDAIYTFCLMSSIIREDLESIGCLYSYRGGHEIVE